MVNKSFLFYKYFGFAACFIFPLITYGVSREIKRGVITHLVGVGGSMICLAIINDGYIFGFTDFESSAIIGTIGIFALYGFLVFDSAKIYFKKLRE